MAWRGPLNAETGAVKPRPRNWPCVPGQRLTPQDRVERRGTKKPYPVTPPISCCRPGVTPARGFYELPLRCPSPRTGEVMGPLPSSGRYSRHGFPLLCFYVQHRYSTNTLPELMGMGNEKSPVGFPAEPLTISPHYVAPSQRASSALNLPHQAFRLC